MKAIFLDRDGVLNKELGRYVNSAEDFELLPVAEILKKFQDAGYLLIVITNQGGISKELYDHKILSTIHQKLTDHLNNSGVKLTEIYYCPHHPDFGNCLCRKPDSLLLEKAIARFKIDKENSYFIGDNERDIEAGKKAGVKTILIPSNSDLSTHIISLLMN